PVRASWHASPAKGIRRRLPYTRELPLLSRSLRLEGEWSESARMTGAAGKFSCRGPGREPGLWAASALFLRRQRYDRGLQRPLAGGRRAPADRVGGRADARAPPDPGGLGEGTALAGPSHRR